MNLESRYRRLLRLYPGAWRETREDEMVATYLDTAPPEGTRPSMKDGLDVAVGALRVRTRTMPPGLPGGARIAGLIGLSAVGMMSAMLLFGVELTPDTPDDTPPFGPFLTPAGLCWALWAGIALASPFLRGTWARRLGLLPMLATSLLILTPEGGPFDRPNRTILLMMVALSATALLHHRGGRATRLIPALSTVVGAVVVLVTLADGEMYWYSYVAETWEWPRDLGVAVGTIALSTLVVSALLQRAEGAWAFVLLTPAVLAMVDSELNGYVGFPFIDPSIDLTEGFVGYDALLLGVGVIPVLVAGIRYLRRRSRP